MLRQIGHFFFEPTTFDEVNGVAHEYKESVKVEYNLRRKVVLLSIWIAVPLLLMFQPDVWGLVAGEQANDGLLSNTSVAGLLVGVGAVIFRTVHLLFLMGIQSGLVWASKIITDRFHDVFIYHKAPLRLLRGELYDDMSDWYTPAPEAKA